jgi:putative FmdB family regulatory protein
MPTYEYGCEACGHEWEEVQRITEPPLEVCPSCGKSSAHRLISAGTNFILKGGGWYSDLYTSPKPSASASEKTEKTEKSDGKAESKAEPASGKTDKAAAKPASAESTTSKPSTTSTTS